MIPCKQRPFNLPTVDKSCLRRSKGLCSPGTKMIDGSKKCKQQLAFELQSSRVFEKHSKLKYKRQQKGATCFATLLQNELKDNVAHSTTHESNLSSNKSDCCKLRELRLLMG